MRVLRRLKILILVHLGCGTMGIAITSGVIASLGSAQTPSPSDEAPAPPGCAISDVPSNLDSSIPSRFLVTCTRDSTAHKLRNLFQDLGHLGQSVEIIQNGNVEAVKRADVVLLWSAYLFIFVHAEVE